MAIVLSRLASCSSDRRHAVGNQPVAYDDIDEHFKYGSIGSEPGGRCCGRSAACCRRTGCSRRCRRSAATSCPAATRRSASSSSRATTCRSASRGGGGSASIRWASTARSATPAPCATSPAAPRRIVLGMPAHQLDLQAFVQFVLDCTLDNRLDGRERPRPISRRRGSAFAVRAPPLPRRPGRSPEAADARSAEPDAPSLGDDVPDWGRGRVDTFNPYKAIQFNWPLDKLPPSS